MKLEKNMGMLTFVLSHVWTGKSKEDYRPVQRNEDKGENKWD